VNDASALWSGFLDELAAGAVALEAVTAQEPPSPQAMRDLAGALFDLRVASSLVGIEPATVVAGYAEDLSSQVADGRAFADARDALAELATVLRRAHEVLANPDLSGARLEDHAALDHVRDKLAALVGCEEVAPPVVATDPTPAATAPAPTEDDTVWVPQVDEDMVEPFLEEATERIEALAQKLLRLEAAPNDAELVREVFRDLHTVKGSSGFVGLRRMNRVAHAAEELVGQLRDGKRSVGRGVIDALLAALDALRALLTAASRAHGSERMRGTRVDVPIDEALRRLAAPDEAASANVNANVNVNVNVNANVNASASAAAPTETRQTLRVDFDKLDSLLNLVGELVLSKARLHESSQSLTALARELDGMLRKAPFVRKAPAAERSVLDDLDRFQRIYAELTGALSDGAGELDHVAADLRQQVMKLRMLPIGRVFTKYHRTVRELSNTLGKRARLEIRGAETELDKVLLEQIDDPLLHLVRNAIDHGVEPPTERAGAGKPEEGVLTLSARHRGNQILVEVADDGAGIDPAKLRKKALEKQLATPDELSAMDEKEVLDLIFRPGFSTAARVTDVSGRGVGMDVVRDAITRLSGSIEIASTPGAGTTFTLKLPLTLAIIQVLLVRVGGDDYALPLDAVERSLAVNAEQIHRVLDREVLILPTGQQVPLLWLADTLELDRALTAEAELPVVLVHAGGELFALAVERLGEKREIVLKTTGELLQQIPCAAGATLLGDRVALILDPVQVVQRGLQRKGAPPRLPTVTTPKAAARPRPRVLVAEDSDVIREALKRVLEAHGCDVLAARDGAEALAIAERETEGFDLISTDVMMPVLDGYELTRRLRAHPRHRNVPIVMVTSRSEHIDRVRGFDAGVDEYLVKPLDSGELVRALERHVHARREPTS